MDAGDTPRIMIDVMHGKHWTDFVRPVAELMTGGTTRPLLPR